MNTAKNESGAPMPRMRTIAAALAQLKRDDPYCCLTRHALRRLVISGKVACFKAGNRYLVNYDNLLAVLGGTSQAELTAADVSSIRRIGV